MSVAPAERVVSHRIDVLTARVATVRVPAVLDPEGLLPEETVKTVIAQGKEPGKKTYVQFGMCNEDGTGAVGIVYRNGITYHGLRRGKDVALDSHELKAGRVVLVAGKKGLWVPAEKFGIIFDSAVNDNG